MRSVSLTGFGVCCVVLLAAAVARAEGSDAAAGKKVVAVLGFASNEGAKDLAPAVENLVATELAKTSSIRVITQADVTTLLGIERQKQLLGAQGDAGCNDSSCVTELAGAVGARYVLNGRLDRFGTSYVLTATVFDSKEAGALAKLKADVKDDGALPQAAKELADGALKALGVVVAPQPSASPSVQSFGSAGKLSLALKFGNAFISNITAFNLSGDLEIGYRFDPEWVGFLQVGATLVRPPSEILPEQFAIVPSVLGARHLYMIDQRFQPYWGLGLGVQLAIADKFGIFQNTGPLPTVLGFGGFHFFVTPHLMLGIEGSMNLAQATLGLTGTGTLGSGFNLDLNGSLGWRF